MDRELDKENKSIFREQALSYLNQCDSTDIEFPKSTNKAWLWLLVSIAFIICITIWLFFTKVDLQVTANGIIIPAHGHSITLVNSEAGKINLLHASAEVKVRKGQTLAILENEKIKNEIEIDKYHLSIESRKIKSYLNLYDKNIEKGYHLQNEQLKNLNLHLNHLVAVQTKLTFRFKQQQKLYDQGMVVKNVLDKLVEDIYNNGRQQRVIKNQINSLNHQFINDCEKEYLQLLSLFSTFELKKLHLLKKIKAYNNAMIVTSPTDGVIISLNVNQHQNVNNREMHIKILKDSENSAVTCILFVNRIDNLNKGMKVKIFTSEENYKRNEYYESTINYIHPYPATKALVKHYLSDSDLTESFFHHGSPYLILTEIINPKSAYAAKTGGKTNLHVGTTVTGKINYQTKTPWQLITTY